MPPSHGHYSLEHDGRHTYHTYAPAPLQAINKLTIDDELSAQLVKAHRLLGKLDGMYCYIPDINILAYPLAHYEASRSCYIETQEALFNERFGAEPLKASADTMIAAYANALINCKTLPFIDGILLDFVRSIHRQMFSHDHDDAGQFRTTQLFTYPTVTIYGGQPNYNPPNPNEMLNTMEALSDYINEPCDFDPLVQIALIYYQLATIRPFLIGNGLVERVCVNFLLADMNLLSRPLLCLSEYLLAGDAEFRDTLRLVRDGFRQYETWVKFFLKVLVMAAEKTICMLDGLYKIRMSDLEALHNYAKCSSLLLALYEYLWKSPITETRNLVSILNVSYNTVAKAVDTLRSLDILKQADEKTRYRRFGYRRLLSILEKQQ